ncbi:F0F1 ATP synthase subunit delta [Nitrosomonas supralitoralis]|uniref:ATP synthase subunit b n=1 Tax=Nitrosomonas supralitoralis TaxID=2116706 RepID=A0A2P7NZ63_9PROT|nr:F0F1 ATP synthase subunit delta [Nitrosomonas supralitoralis]PSJ18744.1 ATPase [Nitrosomonas supralitoralis]
MDLDWTTFVLEIINFLILVWILKRFLYQPILGVIARRRADIDKSLSDALQIRNEANELKSKNEQYLAEWEAKKEAAQAQLNTELASIRESKLAELEIRVNEEAERRRVLAERNRHEFERSMEEKGIAQGVAFTSKLLSRLASPELENRLYIVLMEDLQGLSQHDKHEIAVAAEEPGLQIKIQSTFPLDTSKRGELTRSLHEVAGKALPVVFNTNPELISGFQIDIGAWILHANLRDELKSFGGVLRHAG